MKNKIKLIAIAKDEAAYLPAWIFHHLYFGFDEIDIYVNNTTDNTRELQGALSHNTQVNFINGDQFFKEDIASPQAAAYFYGLQSAKKDEFTHVLCLDIDEFWTPKNFKDSIQDCLAKVGGDVISFEWLNKHSEEIPFGNTFDYVLIGSKGSHVKSIFSTDLKIKKVGAHNIVSSNAINKLADGSIFDFKNKMNSTIPESKKSPYLKDYFIVHRMFRSEMEYVSLLGRGRPSQTGALFKNNRPGYCVSKKLTEFKPDALLLDKYNKEMSLLLSNKNIKDVIEKGKAFVESRHEHVLSLIEHAPLTELNTLKKLLKNVTLTAVKESFNIFKSSKLSNSDINALKSIAIKLEKNNVTDAYKLMLIAHKNRPAGRLIKNKIAYYEKIIKAMS